MSDSWAAASRMVALWLGAGLLIPGSTRAQASWSVQQVPSVDISAVGQDGQVVLEQPVGATRLSDGTIVVADAGAAALRFFAASGRVLRTVGRRGGGPGEFQIISWLGQCGPDSVFIWDLAQRRMSVFSRAGDLVRTYPLPADGSAGPSPFVLACSRTGVFAFQPLPRNLRPSDPASSIVRGSVAVYLADANGRITDSIAEMPGSEMFVFRGGGGPRPLGKTTSLALSAERLFIGTADSALVEGYTLRGSRFPAVGLRIERRRPRAANQEAAVSMVAARVPPPVRDAVRQHMLGLALPEWLPPYSALLTDGEGVLWAVLSSPGDGITALRALTSDGRALADVRVPVELTVHEIGRDYILGAAQDADGAPRIVLFRLRRS